MHDGTIYQQVYTYFDEKKLTSRSIYFAAQLPIWSSEVLVMDCSSKPYETGLELN